MNSEFLIDKIGALIVEDLVEDKQKLPNSLFNLNKSQNRALKHFMLIPELLGTTNLINKDEPNNDGDDDEDMKFLFQKIYQKQINNKFSQKKNFTNKNASFEVDNSLPENVSRAANSNLKRKKLNFSETNGIPALFHGDVDLLNVFDHLQFENYLHMHKLSFLKIFQFIRNLLSKHSFYGGTSAQTVFSLALWKLTTGETYEAIAQRFQKTRRITRNLLQQFLHIISQNYHCYIKWPNSQLSQRLQLQGFQQHSRLQIFPGLFAVIVLESFKVYIKSKNSTENNQFFEVVLQIICNADQKVIDCHLEMANKYNFDDSPIAKLLNDPNNEQILSKQCYLIGKNYFPLRSYLITPFVDPRITSEIVFNQHMNTILNFGQETLNAIVKRFNILRDNSLYEVNDLNLTRQIMQTVCVLHNLSIAIEDDYVDRVTIAPQSKRIRVVSGKEDNVLETLTKSNTLIEDTANVQRRQQLMLELANVPVSNSS